MSEIQKGKCGTLLETPRLILRRFTQNDAPLLYEYSREETLQAQLPDQVYQSLDETREVIAYLSARYDTRPPNLPQVYGVQEKNSGLLIGHAGLSVLDEGVEIGYAIAMAYQGKGYAAEAVRAYVRWAYAQWGVSPVLGIVRQDNKASRAVLQRAGFTLKGSETRPGFGGEYPICQYEWRGGEKKKER